MLIDELRSVYKKRNKVPLVPSTESEAKILTVKVEDIYVHPEMYIYINTPDLPIRYPLKWDQLFKVINVKGQIETGDISEAANPTQALKKTDEWIESSNRVVIGGKTGCGKTTFLQMLAARWANLKGDVGPLDQDIAVFYLNLNRLSYSSNLGDAIIGDLFPRSHFNPEFIEEFIEKNQKRVAFLLDSYDEFRGKDLEPDNWGNIVKLLRNEYLPDVRVLVTTRLGSLTDFKESWIGDTKEYRVIEITGFSSSQIDRYIKKVFVRRPHLARNLLNHLEFMGLKMELASLPLMCCAYCQLTKLTDGKDFKDMNTTSGLFDKLIQCLLEYHRRARKQNQYITGASESEKTETFDRNIDNSDFLLDLGQVALSGFIEEDVDRVVFGETDFKSCMNVAGVVLERGLETGILIRDTSHRQTLSSKKEVENISFVLKIFQESLAGKFLAQELSRNNEDNEIPKIQNFIQKMSLQRITHLRNVLLFASGSNTQAAGIIIGHVITLLKSENEYLERFLEGRIDYKEWLFVQPFIELCFQLNYESQSEGALNNEMAKLLTENGRIRLIEISGLVSEQLGYFLKHCDGSLIKSLVLVRLYGDSEFSLRYWLGTFNDLRSHLSKTVVKTVSNKNEIQISQSKEPEKEKKLKIFKQVAEANNVPKHILIMMSDDVFLNMLPLWEKVNQNHLKPWMIGSVIGNMDNWPAMSWF